MARFKKWIIEENSRKEEKMSKLKDIWSDFFKALGIEGLSDEDAAQQSFSRIRLNQRSRGTNSTFKGKQAVRKRLENNQIFQRLLNLNDPEIRKNVENVRSWLDKKDVGYSANASTTVGILLEKLFGKETFQKFIDADFPKKIEDDQDSENYQSDPKNEDEPQNNLEDGSSSPPVPPGQPMSGMMGEQPPQEPEGSARMPLPQKPAGAELGMF
jgi:hypothetical protein